jgi:hypothetical protein
MTCDEVNKHHSQAMETVDAKVPEDVQRDQIVVSRPSPDSVVDGDSDRESPGCTKCPPLVKASY